MYAVLVLKDPLFKGFNKDRFKVTRNRQITWAVYTYFPNCVLNQLLYGYVKVEIKPTPDRK